MNFHHPKLMRAIVLASVALCLFVGSAFAGSIHITGSTNWALGSLKVSGTVVGLQNGGVTSGFVRFVGYGYCYTPGGAYWTPTDTDQMDGDPYYADDYPEIRLNLINPPNKFEFNLTMPNPPGASQPNAPCAPGTWVWKGAGLQIWQNLDNGGMTLLDQQNYSCFPKRNGDFECR